jgi:gas vesicle protein
VPRETPPQSGKRTRAQIRHKSRELHDQANDSIDQAMTGARSTGRHFTARVHEQADRMQQRGQDLSGEQKERWSPVVEAGKNAVQHTA